MFVRDIRIDREGLAESGSYVNDLPFKVGRAHV